MVVEDDSMTCDSCYRVIFFSLFDVALRPSYIFLDDRFMPSSLLFSYPHCHYDTFDYDHGLFTAVFFLSLLLSMKQVLMYIYNSLFLFKI